jgi:uncharacterized protein (UPF0332 family)
MTDGNRRANSRLELKRARKAFAASGALMGVGLFDDAVTQMDCAAFHHAPAALLTLGVQSESHRGLQTMVSLHLAKPGIVPKDTVKLLTGLFEHRNQADYDRDFDVDAAGAHEDWQALQQLMDSFDAALRAAGFATLRVDGAPDPAGLSAKTAWARSSPQVAAAIA